MKTLFPALSILITTALLFQGCKKNGKEDPPIPVCRVQTMTLQSEVVSYTYDSSKRVSRAVSSSGFVEEYTYKGDTTKILRTNGGTFDSRKIITNNAQGLATQVRIEFNLAGTHGVIINYQYNGTELVQEIEKQIGSSTTDVTIYTWTAGNLTEIRSGSIVTTFDYYTDKPSQPGNYLEAVNLSQGYTIFKTKNLVKTAATNGGPTTITYVFDNDDNISQVLLTSSASNSSIGFAYKCD